MEDYIPPWEGYNSGWDQYKKMADENAVLRAEVERIRANTNDSIQTLGKRIRQLEEAVEWAERTMFPSTFLVKELRRRAGREE